jgi:carbon monoxide dehydrogenase subunit G
MIIDSEKVQINAERKEIFTFLRDTNNLIELLPKKNVSNFESTFDDCSFKVEGGVTISLVHDGNDEENVLYLKSGDKSPFPFRLSIFIESADDGCEGYIHFDGEVNMFLKMMVEKPLTNLFNYMSNKLHEKFSQ